MTRPSRVGGSRASSDRCARPSAVLVIAGRVRASDAPLLAERLRGIVERTGTRIVVCDVATVIEPDAGTIDALARVALAARRLDCKLRLEHPTVELADLLAFAGLQDVLPWTSSSRDSAGGDAGSDVRPSGPPDQT